MSWAYWAPKSTTRTGLLMPARLRVQRRRSPRGHGRAHRGDGRHHLIGRAERRAPVDLALVGPQRHRALGLRGDRERRVHSEVRADRRAVDDMEPGMAEDPVVRV